MSPFVRGNKLFVVETPPSRIAMKTPTKGLGQVYAVCKGDYLWVASSTKNGWMRVKNERTLKVTTLRVGPWVQKLSSNWGRHLHQLEYSLTPKVPVSSAEAPALECIPPTSSCVDQMIRKSQVDKLEAAWEAQESEIIKLETELSESRLLCASRAAKAAEYEEAMQHAQTRIELLESELRGARQWLQWRTDKVVEYEEAMQHAKARIELLESELSEERLLCASRADKSVEYELAMQRAHTRIDELMIQLDENQQLRSTVHDERIKLRDTVVAKIGAIGAAHDAWLGEQVYEKLSVEEWDLASRTLSSALADVRQCVINSVVENLQEDTANGYSSC